MRDLCRLQSNCHLYPCSSGHLRSRIPISLHNRALFLSMGCNHFHLLFVLLESQVCIRLPFD